MIQGKEEGDDPQIIELKDSDDYGHMTRIGNTSGDTMASTGQIQNVAR